MPEEEFKVAVEAASAESAISIAGVTDTALFTPGATFATEF